MRLIRICQRRKTIPQPLRMRSNPQRQKFQPCRHPREKPAFAKVGAGTRRGVHPRFREGSLFAGMTVHSADSRMRQNFRRLV